MITALFSRYREAGPDFRRSPGRSSFTTKLTCGLTAAAFALVPVIARAQAGGDGDQESSYGYFRVVEGDAVLTQFGDGERQQVERHQPVLAGDRLEVDPSGRIEILLSDWNVLRLDGGSDLVFQRLAFSPDSEDTETRLELLRGNLQMIVAADSLGEQAPSIETSNATVFLHRDGVYRITTDPSGWTQVVARSGYAEILSADGSSLVRAGEEAVLDDSRRGFTDIARAGRRDSLERWGEDLDAQALEADPHVDDRLRYAAAPLDDHGTWVSVEGRRAWRPYADPDWRPYWHGRWVYTPSGLSWVSSEPWGWVPYHYGSWDLVPGYGWVWFPGRSFSVAHVHWYWGPEYVAWFPSGYYHRYYSSRFGLSLGFGHGVYGYAGGWDPFDDWFFCPPRYLGHRRQAHYQRTGHRARREHGHRELPPGVITTDTRDLTPERWRDHDRVREVLRARRRVEGDRPVERDLPDVTAFIAREPKLSPEVLQRVMNPEPAGHGDARREGAVRKPVLRGETPVLRVPPKGERPTAGSPAIEPRSPAVDRGKPEVLRRDLPRAHPGTRPEAAPPADSPRRPTLRVPEKPADRFETRPEPRSGHPERPARVEPRVRSHPPSQPRLESRPPSRQPAVKEPAKEAPPAGARVPRVRAAERTAAPPRTERPVVERPPAQRPEVQKPHVRKPPTSKPPTSKHPARETEARETETREPRAQAPEPKRERPALRTTTPRRPPPRSAPRAAAPRVDTGPRTSSGKAAPRQPSPRRPAAARPTEKPKAAPRTPAAGSRPQVRSSSRPDGSGRSAARTGTSQRGSSQRGSSAQGSSAGSRSTQGGSSASRSKSRPSRSSASSGSRSKGRPHGESAARKRTSKPPSKGNAKGKGGG